MFGNSLVKFHAGIKSEATKELYDRYLNYFLKFVKIRDSDGLLQLKEIYLQELVESYAINLKDRGLRKATVDGRLNALGVFFSMNDKILNWKKIMRMTPAGMKSLGGGAWTLEEIKKMLSLTASLRNKAIIHFLACTGVRVGALPELRLRHLADVGNGCRKVVIYENSKDEYVVFTTPETSKALEDYFEQRRKDGEYIHGDSPLFRNAYQIGMQKVRPMSLMAYRLMLYEIIKKMRGNGKGVGERYSTSIFHGFRKRVATIMKENQNGNVSLIEKLLGHRGVVALDSSYFKPNTDILFGEYCKHIGNLTIDNVERERLGRVEAEKKVNELQSEQSKTIEKLISENQEMRENIKGLYELMKKD
jgi:integrase/recombinase XerD